MAVAFPASSLLMRAAPGGGVSIFNNRVVLGTVVLLAVAHFLIGRLPAFHDAFALMLPDNDDAMRLVAVRDLLAGQAWFDPVQHRMKPVEGAAMHWSRFVDAPIAGLILGLRAWFEPAVAERIAVALWPLLALAAYLGLTAVGIYRLFGFRAACFATAAACVLPNTAGLFEPGRIDHHNVQVVAIGGAALCTAWRVPGVRLAVSTGGLCGFSLAIGLETLPFVACLGMVYALFWIREGARETPPLVAFAASLAAGSTLFFVTQTAPAIWLVDRCDALSRPWLTLVGLGAGASACLAAATPLLSTPRSRLVAAAGVGGVAVAVFAALFPVCLAGPFPDMPAIVRSEWLNKVGEATGILAHLKTSPHLVLGYFCPVIVAACFATHGAVRGPAAERRALGVFAALLWAGVAIALVQIRGVYVGSACVPFVTGWAAHRLLAAEAEPRPALLRAAGLGAVTLLLAQAWLLWLPLLWHARPDLRPSDGDRTFQSCNSPAGLAAFDRLPPGLVLAQIDLGANLLLHTRHAILAAPYHRNSQGLLAGIEAFAGTEADLKRHVDRWAVDYVAVCPAWLPPSDKARPFARALVDGVDAPWLERVAIEGAAFSVWRVRKT